MYTASFKRLQIFLSEVCVSEKTKKGAKISLLFHSTVVKEMQIWVLLRPKGFLHFSLCAAMLLHLFATLDTTKLRLYLRDTKICKTHMPSLTDWHRQRAVPLLSPRWTRMNPAQIWTKQTASPSPLWLTSTSSVSWSTDTNVHKSLESRPWFCLAN